MGGGGQCSFRLCCVCPHTTGLLNTMRLLNVVVCALGLISSHVFAQSSSVDSYISTESPIAKAGIIANIGPIGSKSQGAKVRFFSIFLTTYSDSEVGGFTRRES